MLFYIMTSTYLCVNKGCGNSRKYCLNKEATSWGSDVAEREEPVSINVFIERMVMSRL